MFRLSSKDIEVMSVNSFHNVPSDVANECMMSKCTIISGLSFSVYRENVLRKSALGGISSYAVKIQLRVDKYVSCRSANTFLARLTPQRPLYLHTIELNRAEKIQILGRSGQDWCRGEED